MSFKLKKQQNSNDDGKNSTPAHLFFYSLCTTMSTCFEEGLISIMTATPATKKYHILMIAPTMFFADYGGHIRILEEAKILRSLGHRLTILAYPNGRDVAGLDIRRCLGVPFNYRVEVGSSRHRYYLDVMLGLKSLTQVIKHKPDIIHAHLHEGAFLGWFLSKLTGAPLIFDFQGSLTGEMVDHHFLERSGLSFTFFRWLEERVDHLPKVILTSSLHAARLLKEDFGVPAGRIHPTPDCVDPETFQPSLLTDEAKIALKQSLNIPLHKKLIVYAGLLTSYQGADHLLQAMHLLRQQRADFHLLLMGFPAVAHYQAMAQQLAIADLVTLTGKVPYEELPVRLAIGDLATAPKLSATEGCGKILNYMSMGLPTVAFDTPVSREFLGHQGIYAKVHTAEALAEAFNQALNMPAEERARISFLLRQWAITNYSWLKTGQQLELVYQAVLAGHPQPALAVKQATL